MNCMRTHQSGFVHHFPLFLFVAIIVGAILVWKGIIHNPLAGIFSKTPKVEPQAKYENPFKKETQYVNPFEEYKNPFTVNR